MIGVDADGNRVEVYQPDPHVKTAKAARLTDDQLAWYRATITRGLVQTEGLTRADAGHILGLSVRTISRLLLASERHDAESRAMVAAEIHAQSADDDD